MNPTITPHVAEIVAADERYARAAWSVITEPGDSYAGAFVQQFGHSAALAALEGTIARLDDITPGLTAQAQRWLPRLRDEVVSSALRDAERGGIRLVDPTTVPGMSDLGTCMPHVLWVRGDIDALGTERRMLVAGARACTSYGTAVSEEIVKTLVEADVTIYGGLAYGVDGAAHTAALACGGRTVAWLGGGVDRTYPAGHAQLGEQIANTTGSALVSELAPRSAPTKWRFIARGRALAASTQATVVVEAGYRSGSVQTANRAIELGRPVGAVPGSVLSAASSGCHKLLREHGAQVITCGADALELLTS